jgi:hypothetical protein
MKPRIFISAVTREFASTRQRVANVLTRLGYEPVWEDIFGAEPGDLRSILRARMDDCQGLIQLVGHSYGAEPPEPDAEFGRVSYTQFEFHHMRQRGRKTWLIFPGPDCKRDTAPDQLDLPRDPDHPDPAGYQAERRALQEAYRRRLRASEHLYHDPQNDAELELVIERLRDVFQELRRDFERWQHDVKSSLERIENHHRVTRERIRAHLLETSEKRLAADLAAADALTGWEAREQQREAAEQAHAARLTRNDDLTRMFAELEGRADASAVFRELTRIVREEGVEAALAYVERQRPGVLERVRARQAAAREQNRAEFQPLLQAAGLHATKGDAAAARARYREILALEPDWPEALDACVWFLRDQAALAQTHGTLAEAFDFSAEALTRAEQYAGKRPVKPDALRALAAALGQGADALVLRGQPGDAAAALGHYQRNLQLREALLRANPRSAQAARDVVVSHFKFFQFHQRQGDEQAARCSLAAGFAILDSFAWEGRPMDAQMREPHAQLKPLFTLE